MSRDVLNPTVAQLIARIKGRPTPNVEDPAWIQPHFRRIRPAATLLSAEKLREIEALFNHRVLSR